MKTLLTFLIKLFVLQFYRTNAGFFLFFFFFFFGSVNSGSLVVYHMSLVASMLQSPVVLTGVYIFWFLYFLKCILYCKKIINSKEGIFLYNLQALSCNGQCFAVFLIYTLMYAPVLFYSLIVAAVGITKGYYFVTSAIIIFQGCLCWLAVFVLRREFNRLSNRTFSIRRQVWNHLPFEIFILQYLFSEKKRLLWSIKAFSFFLIFIMLVLNKDNFNHDSFLLFYQMVILVHAAIPFLAIQFLEKHLSFYRNLPVRLFHRAFVFMVTYCILMIPEMLYMLWNSGHVISFNAVMLYFATAIATLFLLTAILYSGSLKAGDYVKVVFMLIFISIFAFHAQSYILWLSLEVVMATILFFNGYYQYEVNE